VPCATPAQCLAFADLPGLCSRQTNVRHATRNWPAGVLFVDVGAHDGTEAVEYAKLGQRVLSFEPGAHKISKIQRKLERAGVTRSVTLSNTALSNYTGRAAFMVNPGKSQRDTLASDPLGHGVAQSVNVTTLDRAVGPSEKVAFLKVDAQGHDVEVLRGACELLRQARVFSLLFEVSPKLTLAPDGAAHYAALVQWLGGFGYDCFDCPSCYRGPRSWVNRCRGSVRPLRGAEVHSRFAALANLSFVVQGIEHGLDRCRLRLDEPRPGRRAEC
jgi:FkbM family methyltransferase